MRAKKFSCQQIKAKAITRAAVTRINPLVRRARRRISQESEARRAPLTPSPATTHTRRCAAGRDRRLRSTVRLPSRTQLQRPPCLTSCTPTACAGLCGTQWLGPASVLVEVGDPGRQHGSTAARQHRSTARALSAPPPSPCVLSGLTRLCSLIPNVEPCSAPVS